VNWRGNERLGIAPEARPVQDAAMGDDNSGKRMRLNLNAMPSTLDRSAANSVETFGEFPIRPAERQKEGPTARMLSAGPVRASLGA
jgi:hypothetical protein